MQTSRQGILKFTLYANIPNNESPKIKKIVNPSILENNYTKSVLILCKFIRKSLLFKKIG